VRPIAASLHEELRRLEKQHDQLRQEFEALEGHPGVDHLPHLRRLETHREQLRAFREKLRAVRRRK
jgi:hypothetical protein